MVEVLRLTRYRCLFGLQVNLLDIIERQYHGIAYHTTPFHFVSLAIDAGLLVCLLLADPGWRAKFPGVIFSDLGRQLWVSNPARLFCVSCASLITSHLFPRPRESRARLRTSDSNHKSRLWVSQMLW